MPLYRFACPNNDVAERIVPYGTERIDCTCGRVAERVSAFAASFVLEPTAAPEDQRRHSLALYREATEEREYYHRREEDRAQRPLPSPNLWLAAKRRARMVQAGLAPPPSGTH